MSTGNGKFRCSDFKLLLSYKSTKPTPYYELLNGKVKCRVCERGCLLSSGSIGFCKNRVNIEGKLYTLGYGLLSALESRPIEIKPFYHYYPGSTALTFSNWGCNFYCPWCQNYTLSFQSPNPERDKYTPPGEIVKLALKFRDEGVCASFNEPTVQVEYLLDVFSQASRKGLYSCIVTNGYFTLRVLRELLNSGLSGLSIDIKGCPESYKRFLPGVNPEIVFRNAREAVEHGAHVEMVFLVVTGANDSLECIEWVLDRHLKVLGEDVPLHINRYYPAHKYFREPTSLELLIKVYREAKKRGIKYVYIGNVGLPEYESTYCPSCGKLLVYRRGYEVLEVKVSSDNRCPRCNEKVLLYGSIIRKDRRWSIGL